MTMADTTTDWRPWTVPNLVTLVRLLCIPVFLWLLFAADERGAAAWLLAVLGSTDWVDGWIARRFDQTSEFGKVFDPAVDRLLFLVAVPALILAGAIPLVVSVLALVREGLVVLMAATVALLRLERFPVTWEGKTGTFLLMFAFPLFLGADSDLSYAELLGPLAWLFAVPGLGYSWYALLAQYLPTTWREFRARAHRAA